MHRLHSVMHSGPVHLTKQLGDLWRGDEVSLGTKRISVYVIACLRVGEHLLQNPLAFELPSSSKCIFRVRLCDLTDMYSAKLIGPPRNCKPSLAGSAV